MLPAVVESLARRYERNPTIRALIQLIPYGIGSSVDVFIATIIDNIREDRARAFFDELAGGNIMLTEEQIQSEDFLHAYFATTRAALNTRRRDKIRLFARLLANYSQGKSFNTTDAYEETLALLDDLSFREFQILLILYRFEANTSLAQGAVERAKAFWNDFLIAVETEVSIPIAEIPGVLVRLNRTGLYATFTGAILGGTGGTGGLTPNFAVFLKALGNDSNDVSVQHPSSA